MSEKKGSRTMARVQSPVIGEASGIHIATAAAASLGSAVAALGAFSPALAAPDQATNPALSAQQTQPPNEATANLPLVRFDQWAFPPGPDFKAPPGLEITKDGWIIDGKETKAKPRFEFGKRLDADEKAEVQKGIKQKEIAHPRVESKKQFFAEKETTVAQVELSKVVKTEKAETANSAWSWSIPVDKTTGASYVWNGQRHDVRIAAAGSHVYVWATDLGLIYDLPTRDGKYATDIQAKMVVDPETGRPDLRLAVASHVDNPGGGVTATGGLDLWRFDPQNNGWYITPVYDANWNPVATANMSDGQNEGGENLAYAGGQGGFGWFKRTKYGDTWGWDSFLYEINSTGAGLDNIQTVSYKPNSSGGFEVVCMAEEAGDHLPYILNGTLQSDQTMYWQTGLHVVDDSLHQANIMPYGTDIAVYSSGYAAWVSRYGEVRSAMGLNGSKFNPSRWATRANYIDYGFYEQMQALPLWLWAPGGFYESVVHMTFGYAAGYPEITLQGTVNMSPDAPYDIIEDVDWSRNDPMGTPGTAPFILMVGTNGNLVEGYNVADPSIEGKLPVYRRPYLPERAFLPNLAGGRPFIIGSPAQ